MSSEANQYQFAYTDAPAPSPASLKTGFSISAQPDTDIWAKPPNTTPFNAPTLHRTFPLSRFRAARVDVSANWETLYDQGGLLLVIREPGADAAMNATDAKWVKTGVEFFNGKPFVGTVARDAWADWSLLPIPPSPSTGGKVGVTVEVARGEDNSLWVYLVNEAGEKTAIREVTWPFANEAGKECWVGVYAARPNKDAGAPLKVSFANLEIKTVD